MLALSMHWLHVFFSFSWALEKGRMLFDVFCVCFFFFFSTCVCVKKEPGLCICRCMWARGVVYCTYDMYKR